MKKQMLKAMVTIATASLLLMGCGGEEDTMNTSKETETETNMIESECSSQEENNSQETTEVVKNESEMPSTEETTTTQVHEHSYSSKITKEDTCATKGEIKYTCSCGDSYTEEVNERLCVQGTDYVITREPDCQHYGIKDYLCIYCGNIMGGEEIPKLPHVTNPDEDDWFYYPELGLRVKFCVNCGVVAEEDYYE